MSGFDGYPNYHNGNWFPAIIPTAAIEGKNCEEFSLFESGEKHCQLN